jgi:hypothetical protein
MGYISESYPHDMNFAASYLCEVLQLPAWESWQNETRQTNRRFMELSNLPPIRLTTIPSFDGAMRVSYSRAEFAAKTQIKPGQGSDLDPKEHAALMKELRGKATVKLVQM